MIARDLIERVMAGEDPRTVLEGRPVITAKSSDSLGEIIYALKGGGWEYKRLGFFDVEVERSFLTSPEFKELKSEVRKVSEGLAEGRRVRVPSFRTSRDAEDWIARLGPNDSPVDDVVDPESGEILMEPGETKRKKAKRSMRGVGRRRKPTRYQDTDSPLLDPPGRGDYWRDERQFNDFYNVVMKPMADEVDDPEHMMAMDYDVSYDFPAVVARKDRKPLNQDDVDNIQYFLDYRYNIGPFNIKLQPIGLKVGGKIVKTMLTFV